MKPSNKVRHVGSVEGENTFFILSISLTFLEFDEKTTLTWVLCHVSASSLLFNLCTILSVNLIISFLPMDRANVAVPSCAHIYWNKGIFSKPHSLMTAAAVAWPSKCYCSGTTGSTCHSFLPVSLHCILKWQLIGLGFLLYIFLHKCTKGGLLNRNCAGLNQTCRMDEKKKDYRDATTKQPTIMIQTTETTYNKHDISSVISTSII